MKSFSFWGRKYTLWALIDLNRATGDARCRAAAVKLTDNLMAQLDRLGTNIWQTGCWHGVSSMSILKPLLQLYEDTRDERYLAFARKIVRALQDPSLKEGALLANARRKEKIMDWFPKPAYWAKAYEIMSCLEGAVHYWRLTGEKSALDDVRAFYGHLEREELNPMCSAGYFDHFLNAAVRPNGMSELCDVTHWTFWCSNTNGFTTMTGADGWRSNGFACPLDPAFRQMAGDYLRDFAKCGVDLIMFDDDFRYGHLHGSALVCTCPRHMAAICARLGETVAPCGTSATVRSTRR